MRKTSSPYNHGSSASFIFDMGDWDDLIVHATNPTAVGNLTIEESLNGGTTWIQLSSTATAIGVPLRVTQNNCGPSIRVAFTAGHGTNTWLSRRRRG